MSQSVKLSNGNYIDAEGVWDATQGKSQSALNALGPDFRIQVCMPATRASVDIDNLYQNYFMLLAGTDNDTGTFPSTSGFWIIFAIKSGQGGKWDTQWAFSEDGHIYYRRRRGVATWDTWTQKV